MTLQQDLVRPNAECGHELGCGCHYGMPCCHDCQLAACVFDLPDQERSRLGRTSRLGLTQVALLETAGRALREAAEVVEHSQHYQEVVPQVERRLCARYAEHGRMFIEYHDLVCIRCGYREPAVGEYFHVIGMGTEKIMEEVPVP